MHFVKSPWGKTWGLRWVGLFQAPKPVKTEVQALQNFREALGM